MKSIEDLKKNMDDLKESPTFDELLNLLDEAYYLGIDDGEDIGYKKSMNDNSNRDCDDCGSYDDGYEEGYDVGHLNAQKEEYDRGHNEGYDEGYNEGYDNGYDERCKEEHDT